MPEREGAATLFSLAFFFWKMNAKTIFLAGGCMNTANASRRRVHGWTVTCIALALTCASTGAQAADRAKGKAKADMACAVCHGNEGISTQPNAPHLAGQPEIYLVEQLKNYRSGKRPHEVMAVLAKALKDDEIDNLAAWYASIEIKATVKP
jgi:cytochrome c553